MTMTADDLRAEIRVESRAAGLGSSRAITGSRIKRRRHEIIATAVILAASAGLVVLLGVVWGGVFASGVLRGAMILVVGVVTAYIVEKHRHLSRVEHLASEMNELEAETAQRLIDQVVYSDIDDGLRKSLLVEDTLDGLLDGAVELARGGSGTLYLLRDDGMPSVWTRRDGSFADTAPESAAVMAAKGRVPVLVDESGKEVERGGMRMASPLAVNGTPVAVIEVIARPVQTFDTVDLELLYRFCMSSEGALDGSSLYNDALRRTSEIYLDENETVDEYY